MRDAKRRIFCDKNNEIMSHYQFLACVIQKNPVGNIHSQRDFFFSAQIIYKAGFLDDYSPLQANIRKRFYKYRNKTVTNSGIKCSQIRE